MRVRSCAFGRFFPIFTSTNGLAKEAFRGFDNPHEFTQAEKEEQEIAEACNRLIKNSIIYWNYLYLARQIEKAPDVETREALHRAIAAHATMAWAHINMLGEYDCSDEKLRDTIGNLPLKSAA